jgi:hypothetical protein
MLGDLAGLVGLDLADEMPLQGQIRQVRHLGEGLLEVVFTEGKLTGGMGRADRPGAPAAC